MQPLKVYRCYVAFIKLGISRRLHTPRIALSLVYLTVFADVQNDMSIIKFKNIEEVIELANITMYGLVAGVWTQDITKAHK